MVFLEWYYLLLVANALVSDPAAHINTGIHQQRGDCDIRAADLSGHMRQVYLCEKSHTQVAWWDDKNKFWSFGLPNSSFLCILYCK